ncbi:hypothetical protein F7734_10385 [Scytonema sp. UIC 10036]|uniref:hypothetical protein n=1 Tax=Scytonema sp. UIC 10036 TaxID=2304196 RepID=UPI0012DAB4FE|nr:hypothetical protein [Scytonema sp. UIC 10036]MUG92833.1 hypothetical protein [Scytonema sp. UIC 10036]
MPKSELPKEHTETVSVEVVEFEELTLEEQQLRLQLERKVERSFYECGKALMELRNKRLYRSTHKTFEQYCQSRFSFTHRNVNYLIAGSEVVDNLLAGTNGSQIQIQDGTGTNGSQILPTNERQVRPLTKLEPDQQREVWQQAVEKAGNKVPSGRIVKDVFQRIMERTKVPNPYRIGEVCQFVVKDNPDLRGKGGCWSIVNRVGDFSCTVTSWDGEYTVSMDHLKSLEYSDSNCQQMKEISDRISKLRQKGNLEKAAINVLRQLGEVKRPYLTPFEEKLLNFIEQECGVMDEASHIQD